MAMTADSSSSNHHSPRSGGGGGDGVRRKHLPSRWAQVVSGELEPPSAAKQPQSPPPPRQSSSPPAAAEAPEQASSSLPLPADDVHAAAEGSDSSSNNAGSARPKKPAWRKPSPTEGASAASSDVGPLIGDAVAWPELSKASKPVPRVGAADSASPSGTITEGSNSNSEGPVAATNPPRRQSHSTNNPSLNPTTPHPTAPARQRPPNKRGGGLHPPPFPFTPPPPPPPPPFPLFRVAPPNAYPNRPNWQGRPISGFPSQPRPINEHRNSSRRGNFGSHPRGEGPRDRGNYGSGRDANMQTHRANSRGFMRSPPPVANPPPFLPPLPHGRPFMAPVPYPDMAHMYYPAVPMDPFRGGIFFPNGPPPPMLYPVPEHPLHISIVRQIEYYFSDDNLARDEFLKSNMDNEGWVPISLIANFTRVQAMTRDTQLILHCLRVSNIVEVQDEKLRRRNDWARWVRPSGPFSSDGSSPSSAGSSHNALAASFEGMAMAESSANSSRTSQSEDAEGPPSTDKTNSTS